MKWFFRLILIGLIGSFAYVAIEGYQKGYFSIPDIPEGAYVISMRGGMRGIVLDANVAVSYDSNSKFFRRLNLANPDRGYISVPSEVAPWFEDVWSTCVSPTEEERDGFPKSFPEKLSRKLSHARFDAVCTFEVDGEKVLRGLLYSVPKI